MTSAAVALFIGLCAATAAATPLEMNFDGGAQIVDGGAGDLDGLVNGKIDFSGVYGLAGYMVTGTLRESPPFAAGTTISQQLTPPIYSLTLTNFTAEALPTSTLGAPLDMRYNSDPFVGGFLPGTAVDSLAAEVASSTASPIPAGTDALTNFFSIIGDNATSIVIAPATGASVPMSNPFYPGTGTTAYPITGHGVAATPAYVNPTIYGLVQLTLGQVGDQFLMPSSAEIGFTAVPEPASIVLFALGLIALAVTRRRD